MTSTTAILLFSRSAPAEAEKKCFGNPAAAAQATAAMLRRTRQTLGRSGFPVYHFDEARQRGSRFGDRLANAMASVFAYGYDQLIVVGSDCPALRVGHLCRTARALERGQAVLGPDQRGGIWLLGLQRSRFDAEMVREIPWQTRRAFTGMRVAMKGVLVLPRLCDLNDRRDLIRNWHLLRSLLPELYRLLNRRHELPNWTIPGPGTDFTGTASGRAPPGVVS